MEEYLVRYRKKLHQDPIGEIDREDFFVESYCELANWYDNFGDKLPVGTRIRMRSVFGKRGGGT